jgi:micrococcal nuclease
LSGLFPASLLRAESVRVAGVIDGDTIQLADGRRVRYLGINAPEREGDRPAEFMSRQSYLFNRNLVLNQKVRLEYGLEKKDRFERILAYVFSAEGLFINGEMVKNGLAHVFYPGPWLDRFGELLKYQQQAIEQGRGIWVEALRDSEKFYRGQLHSRRFHRPQCAFGKQMASRNLILFNSKKEAYRQGYSPCRTCRP